MYNEQNEGVVWYSEQYQIQQGEHTVETDNCYSLIPLQHAINKRALWHESF